ncbi:MAG: hypothetical protein IPJ30_10225 [Acidobacteria bacterium]|nr:hypothetical protein [Acidobacteriota bacterium]
MNDYAFDAAGNTTSDPQMRKFTYDAENKQTKVESINSSGTVTGMIGEYFYDGDGRRVKKIAYANNQPTETTVFVYDASSKLVAEYSTTLNPTPQVAYVTNDHLGSPRINTNENGTVIARHDYRPYGEEITDRTHAQYVADTVRKKFTGYEGDNETNIDYAMNRYYNNRHGRFTSVDPENAGADEDDPQSWDGYAYGRNNPVLFTDPNGLEYRICNQEGQCWTHSDGDFKKGQRQFSGLYQETDRDGHYDSGNILDSDGNVVGTYERTSIDRDYQFVYGVAEQSVRKAKVVGVLAAGAFVVGACIGTGTCAVVGAAALASGKVVLKGSLKYSSKIARQMSRRGWSKEQVEATIKKPHTTAKGTSRAGESVTAYVNKDGSYVVVRDATQEILQISDKTRPWNFPTDWKWK